MVEQTIPFQAEQHNHEPITERSDLERFPSSQQVFCQPIAPGTADNVEPGWWGTLRNISSEGLAVCLPRPLEPGTELIIEWSDKAKRQTRCFHVQVIHAAAEGNMLWIVGCEFVRPQSEEEDRDPGPAAMGHQSA
jgi:hypothetical protein